MTKSTKASNSLSQEQVEVISGDFAAYSRFFNRLTDTHFPHLNAIMLDRKDPDIFERVREGVMGVFERPETQRRLGNLTYTEALPVFRHYAETLTDQIIAFEAQFSERPEDKAQYRAVGAYIHTYPSSEIVNSGAQVSPLIINGGHCNNCKPGVNLHACTATPPDVADGLKLLDRVSTGFHELAHALTMHGRIVPGVTFSRLVSGKNSANQAESIADSFAALMMVREFGQFGADHVRLSHNLAGMDADHTTLRAVAATRDWMSENEDKIFSLSPAELFKVAYQIGDKHALTPAEHNQAQHYQANYNKSHHFTLDAVHDRIEAYEKHQAGQGQLPAGYGPLAYEFDQFYRDFKSSMSVNVTDMAARMRAIQQCATPNIPDTGLIDTSALTKPEAPAAPLRMNGPWILIPPRSDGPNNQ